MLFVTQQNFDIFAVSETLLKDSIPSELVNIAGYNLERKDRFEPGGGVGLYVKENIDYFRRQEFENVDIEFICLEIISKHTKPYFLCVLYRPPKSSKHSCKNFIKLFDNILSKMLHENKEIIITGDVNCNYLDESNERPFKDLLSLNGFIQTVQSATRITPQSETLIDVILSNSPEKLSDIKVIPTALSDHDTVYCVRDNNIRKEPFETITCRDYSNYNPADLRNDFVDDACFTTVYNDKNPDSAWNSLKNILSDTFNRHAPLINKRVKAKKSPWINREIKNEMNIRDALLRKSRKSKNLADFERFKIQRNKVNGIVRKAKSKHYQNLLKESTHNAKKFWKVLKNIFPTKEKISTSKTFLINGTLVSNIHNIASGFANFLPTWRLR